MKINREDVVQAALTVIRWCKEHRRQFGDDSDCDCPFGTISLCFLRNTLPPELWRLEEYLRTRGLKHDD